MLTDDELRILFLDSESDRVERKRSASDPKKIRQAICAFANDLAGHNLPGVIFVGQDDDGSCANIDVDDALLLKLAGWRGDGEIQPLPRMQVAAKTIEGCRVAVIEVAPSHNTPVRFQGRVWVRVGPSRAVASVADERLLDEKRRWGDLPFDVQGVDGATSEDLDLARFQSEILPAMVAPDVLAANGRTIEERLRSLRFLTREGQPTVSAILAMGIEPRQWVPGAYVQFLRIDGTRLTDRILDQREVSGTLSDQIVSLDQIVKLNIKSAAKVGDRVREDVSDYPAAALRQVLRNALIHRTYDGTHAPVRVTWYNDRIEIQSPGGPFGQVTVQNFGQPGMTDYRNAAVAEVMKALGYTERFGVGIEIAQQELRENGNPALQFEVYPQHILAVMRPAT